VAGYSEVEEICPDGKYTLVESSREQCGPDRQNSKNIDYPASEDGAQRHAEQIGWGAGIYPHLPSNYVLPRVTVPVTVPASFKTKLIPTNATQNEGGTISTNYLPFQRFTEPGGRSENPRVDGSIPPPGTNRINKLRSLFSLEFQDFFRLSYRDASGRSSHFSILPVNVNVPCDSGIGVAKKL
jgi:hypothetical protein